MTSDIPATLAAGAGGSTMIMDAIMAGAGGTAMLMLDRRADWRGKRSRGVGWRIRVVMETGRHVEGGMIVNGLMIIGMRMRSVERAIVVPVDAVVKLGSDFMSLSRMQVPG